MARASGDARWSRGCGTGVGLSHHKHEFRLGVNIGNWTEDREAVMVQQPAVGGTGRFTATSSHRTDFVPEGKFGDDAIEASARVDLETSVISGRSGEILLQHGDFTEPRITCFATTNQLAFGEKAIGEPKVQTYLWSGSKFNDFNVPRDKLQVGLNTMKRMQWDRDEEYDMYKTTNKAFQEPVIGQFTKRETMKPQAEGGQMAQVGRKANGEMAESREQTYLKTGLRQPIKKPSQ